MSENKRFSSYVERLNWALGLVHTNTFSFENAFISLHHAFRSHWYTGNFHRKLIDSKTLFKVDQNETAYMCRISVDGQKRSKTRQNENENIAGRTCNSIVFERFSVDCRKCIKTVVWTQIDRCFFDDKENAYLWKRVIVDRASVATGTKSLNTCE